MAIHAKRLTDILLNPKEMLEPNIREQSRQYLSRQYQQIASLPGQCSLANAKRDVFRLEESVICYLRVTKTTTCARWDNYPSKALCWETSAVFNKLDSWTHVSYNLRLLVDYIDWYMNEYLEEEELPWQWVSCKKMTIYKKVIFVCFLHCFTDQRGQSSWENTARWTGNDRTSR